MVAAALQPVFLVSPRYRNEIAAAIEAHGWPVVAARRGRDAERRFSQSGATIAVVDARGALDSGIEIARTLASAVEARGAALLLLLSRGEADALREAYEAGATHFLMSPFGATELAQAIRFAERLARRLSARGGAARHFLPPAEVPEWHWRPGSAGIEANDALDALIAPTGETADHGLRQLWRRLDSGGRRDGRDAVRRLLASGRATAFASRLRVGDRSPRLAHHLHLERDEQGRVESVAATVEALDAVAEERRQSANFDQLTGLANAAATRRWINRHINKAGPYDPAVIAIMIAISRFDAINAAFGRSVGDQLLAGVGRRLARLVEEDDGERALVARLAGAEFMVALSPPVTLNEAVFQAQQIAESFRRAFLVEGQVIHLACRMGIAVGEVGVDGAETVLNRASAALSEAKDQEPNSFQVYVGDALGEALAERATIESELRRAMEEDQLELFYQPQIGIADGALVGVEALVRWTHPRLGALGAETIISAASRAEILAQLDEHILAKALRNAARWPASLDGVRLSLNVTAADLAQAEFHATLPAMVAASGFSADLLTIEVTESDLIEDLERASDVLSRFRDAGFRIALDDFGTGYSSLAYLKTLPLDYLKLDKRLVADLAGSARDRVVVHGVIDMARSLGLTVVAEGVERPEQLALLARAGCSLYQGFLAAPALDQEGLTRFADARRLEFAGAQ